MSGKRKLGRATAHRMAMLRAMVTFLLENGRIETTVTRAKEVRSLAEKMITLAKVDNLHNKRMAMAFITKKDVARNLFSTIAPSYAGKNGGYTRITKLGPRRGDGAEMAVIELVKEEVKEEKKQATKAKAKPKTKAKTKETPKAKAKVKEEVKEEVKEKAEKSAE